jgi:Tannase and feruloyl esterase.
MRIAYNDPNVDWHNFDLDRDMKFLDEKIGYVDAVNPDLSKFKSSGGKLLITHGWSDTSITPETQSGITNPCSTKWARTRVTGCGCSWCPAWRTAAAVPA